MASIEGLKLSFQQADGTPRMKIAIVGENGVGKTRILQQIAEEGRGVLLGRDSGEGYLVAGYGVHRRPLSPREWRDTTLVHGKESLAEYTVRSLFAGRYQLLGDIGWGPHGAWINTEATRWMNSITDDLLQGAGLRKDSTGWHTTQAWARDFLTCTYLFYEREPVPSEEIVGALLVDEIELHLHPKAQRLIIPALRKVFPRVQLIVTTNSPLVLTSFDVEEIVVLEREGNRVVRREVPYPTGLSTSSEILTAYFDVPRAGRPDLIELEREYLGLLGWDKDKRTKGQRHRIKELEDKLSPYFVDGLEEDDAFLDEE